MIQKHLQRKNPGVWEPDVMVVAMPTPSPNRSPKKQGISLSNRQICNILCCQTYFPYSFKTYTKKSKKSFSENLWIRKNDPCCFFFSGHQGATNISTSCQLRYQTPSLETDGFLKVGPLPVPQLAIYKAMAITSIYLQRKVNHPARIS